MGGAIGKSTDRSEVEGVVDHRARDFTLRDYGTNWIWSRIRLILDVKVSIGRLVDFAV
jgi:hypothetical protein